MEIAGGSLRASRKSSRETSPDRARVCFVQQNQTNHHHQLLHNQQNQQLLPMRVKPFRKVQVVYYLCRNGQLEQPHFMEVTHLPNQHLRLKDVIDRLTVLRGNKMPSLYSWSCKRSYKNGFVWNDLSENDVIYPAEGAEYILKGSEIVQGCTDRFQQLQVTQRTRQLPGQHHSRQGIDDEQDDEELEEQEGETEEPDEYKHVHHNNAGSCSNTPNSSRCSRGVSTEELDLLRRANPVAVITTPPKSPHHQLQQQQPTELPLDEAGASPPSSSSSEKLPNPAPESASIRNTGPGHGSSRRTDFSSARFEDALNDPDVQPARPPSVLLQLIACGSVAAVKGKAAGLLMRHSSSTTSSSSSPISVPNNNNNSAGVCGNSGRKSGVNLHKGVLCRLAAASSRAAEDDDEITYMSENPRFGNPQLEDKEYFSGSILEAISNESRAEATQPSLKKSSSYNEERSTKCGLGEVAEKVVAEERNVKAKCMPSRNWMRSTCRK